MYTKLIKGRKGAEIFASGGGWGSVENLKANLGLDDEEIDRLYFDSLEEDELDYTEGHFEVQEIQVLLVSGGRPSIVSAHVRVNDDEGFIDEDILFSMCNM